MEEKKMDLRKLEIPPNVLEEYRTKLGLLGDTIPIFWGGAIEHLIKLVKSGRDELKISGDEIEKLNAELEIRTIEFRENKLASVLTMLEELGYNVKLSAEKEK